MPDYPRDFKEGGELSARELNKLIKLARRTVTGPLVTEDDTGWHIRPEAKVAAKTYSLFPISFWCDGTFNGPTVQQSMNSSQSMMYYRFNCFSPLPQGRIIGITGNAVTRYGTGSFTVNTEIKLGLWDDINANGNITAWDTIFPTSLKFSETNHAIEGWQEDEGSLFPLMLGDGMTCGVDLHLDSGTASGYYYTHVVLWYQNTSE